MAREDGLVQSAPDWDPQDLGHPVFYPQQGDYLNSFLPHSDIISDNKTFRHIQVPRKTIQKTYLFAASHWRIQIQITSLNLGSSQTGSDVTRAQEKLNFKSYFHVQVSAGAEVRQKMLCQPASTLATVKLFSCHRDGRQKSSKILRIRKSKC